jgi:SPP1 gp7 family putative phage head morphogenesis protein
VKWPWTFARKRPEGDIYRRVRRQQIALLRGEDKAVKQMGRVWKDSEKAILARLDLYIERLAQAQAAGLEISPNWAFQIDRYVELLGTIGQELNRYGLAAEDITERQQRTAGELGVNHAQELMRASEIGTSFVRVPVNAVANIVGALNDGSPLRDLFNSLGPDAIDTAERTFTTLMAAGKGPKEMARVFKKELGITRRRAELITRTESLRAYRESQRTNYKANASVISGWRWVSARDSRTCPICLAMDGSEHELDEQMATHPACRCTQSPIPKYRRVARQTGEDFLREKPEAEQKRILGPSRYARWKGGMSLRDMVETVPNSKWGPSTRLIPLVRLGNASASTPPRPTPTPTRPAPSRPATNPAPISTPRPIAPTSTPAAPPAGASGLQLIGTPTAPAVGIPLPPRPTQTADPFKKGYSTTTSLVTTPKHPRKLTRNMAAAVKRAGDAIDRVHGPDGMASWPTPLPIANIGQAKAMGRFYSKRSNGDPAEIQVGRTETELTFVHEFGHYFDASMAPFGGIVRRKIASLTQAQQVAIEAFFKAVDKSDGIAKANEYATKNSRIFQMLEAYHLQPYELWARAYCQTIAELSKDSTLLSQLAAAQSRQAIIGVPDVPEHWETSDFGPIRDAVVEVIRAFGAMK